MRADKRAVFLAGRGARLYAWLTDHHLWREHLAEVVRGPDLVGARVLDVGCGPGDGALVLGRLVGPGGRVTGVDLSTAMVEIARHRVARRAPELRARVALQEADAADLPFADASFDVTIGHSFLYLVADPAAVLRELTRVLAPGGRLVLLEPRAQLEPQEQRARLELMARMARMEQLDLQGHRVQLGQQVPLGQLEQRERMEPQEPQVQTGLMAQMEPPELLEPQGQLAHRELREHRGPQGPQAPQVLPELLALPEQ